MDKQFIKNGQKDWRYPIAHKEAIIGIALAVFHFIWWFGFSYGLGSKPVESYTYTLGFPTWFFYGCIIGFIVMVILVIIVVKKMFREIPLDTDEEGKS